MRDAASEGEGVGPVPTHPGIEHDVDVRTGGIAKRFGELDISRHPLAAIRGSPAGEPLQSAEALGHLFLGAAAGQDRFQAVAQHGGVGGGRGADGTAQKAVNGLIEVATFEIPEGAIDGTDGHHGGAFATVDGLTEHHVPDSLGGEWIDSLQEAAKLAVDDPRHFVRDRTGKTA